MYIYIKICVYTYIYSGRVSLCHRRLNPEPYTLNLCFTLPQEVKGMDLRVHIYSNMCIHVLNTSVPKYSHI